MKWWELVRPLISLLLFLLLPPIRGGGNITVAVTSKMSKGWLSIIVAISIETITLST